MTGLQNLSAFCMISRLSRSTDAAPRPPARVHRAREDGRGRGWPASGIRAYFSFVRGVDRAIGALTCLVGQGGDAGLLQSAQDAPDPGGAQIVRLPGSAPDVHTIVPSGEVMTCTFIPCTRCLPEKYDRSAAMRSVWINVPSSTR